MVWRVRPMPWKIMDAMDQKITLISDWNSSAYSKAELARKYELSRQTIYKWLLRYEQEGIDGLKERSRAPHECANKTSQDLINAIISRKRENMKRGPKKIIAQLAREYPGVKWPAPSTAGEWLKRYDLTKRRKKRHRVAPYTEPFRACAGPNTVWSADYKGQFQTLDGKLCYPLTISDNYSRYLIRCAGLNGPRHYQTKAVFESAFREYGLPDAIRTDNGTPFAYSSIGGLSYLSIWWILLGIVPERIEKGCPEQNGRHERMHRTLKDEAIDPPASTLKDQRVIFDEFRKIYNTARPHEALGQKYPIDYYRPSLRAYPKQVRKPEYGSALEVRYVCNNGHFMFRNEDYFISKLLANYPIGLKEVDDGYWQIYFSFHPIGHLDIRKKRIVNKVYKENV
jgi:transposase InsO family protein